MTPLDDPLMVSVHAVPRGSSRIRFDDPDLNIGDSRLCRVCMLPPPGARPGREAGRRDSRSRGVGRPPGRSTPRGQALLDGSGRLHQGAAAVVVVVVGFVVCEWLLLFGFPFTAAAGRYSIVFAAPGGVSVWRF